MDGECVVCINIHLAANAHLKNKKLYANKTIFYVSARHINNIIIIIRLYLYRDALKNLPEAHESWERHGENVLVRAWWVGRKTR